jgi:hypothetical protein
MSYTGIIAIVVGGVAGFLLSLAGKKLGLG